ncbi:MAG: sulfatase-like hydrolase/transferase [Pseudomonadota bacterium]|nr:sulfatase-like hydrolase/transferase [Pseudomonadota bacterium]
MAGNNVLILCSDEHTPRAMGCSGHPLVKTPHLDALAARGTRFTNAYTNSPICVSARASLATGQYVHQIGCWSSAEPYTGQVPSWGHRLMADGHRVVSIGKLHYRDTNDPNGFDEEIVPMHLLNGVGWVTALLRGETLPDADAPAYAAEVGAGETTSTAYDRTIRDNACAWLRNQAPRHRKKPWVLFVSFVSPHFPLVAPAEFHALYRPDDMDPPFDNHARHDHPVVAGLAGSFNYHDYFDDERVRQARAGYYGLCSFLDDNIGAVLGALDDGGLSDDTTVIYTSDHGDMIGNHGLWAKSHMYEDSVGVPMMVSGPGVAAGETVEAPVSLVDIYPTVVEAAGATLNDAERVLPGDSLVRMAAGERPARTVLSEYHDGGAITGIFMIRHGRWKYIHYVGYDPQLFDLEADPDELADKGTSADHAKVRAECEAALRRIVDPEAASARAFTDQAAKVAALGGETAVRAMQTFGYTPVSSGD